MQGAATLAGARAGGGSIKEFTIEVQSQREIYVFHELEIA